MNGFPHPLLDPSLITSSSSEYVEDVGDVFVRYEGDGSGNIAYGVCVGEERFFVKTAGEPGTSMVVDDTGENLRHAERVALLRNAVRIARGCTHPAVPKLHNVIESSTGPMLIYEWVDGERLGVSAAVRSDPRSSFQRFRRLPPERIGGALDTVYDLHAELARQGWIAVDFYDGSLMYNFGTDTLRVIDLDMYRDKPFRNEMGRMFGSSRFMAPEEFELGAMIDERTTVFVMGRTAAVFLSDGSLDPGAFGGSSALLDVVRKACSPDPSERYQTVAAFHRAWSEACTGVSSAGR